MKTLKDYHDFYLKCDVVLLADDLKNLEINAKKIMICTLVIISLRQL